MSTADEIEQEAVTAAWTQFQRMPSSNPSDYAHAVRLAIMPLVRRAQAEAWDEGFDEASDDLGRAQMMRDHGESTNPYIEGEDR